MSLPLSILTLGFIPSPKLSLQKGSLGCLSSACSEEFLPSRKDSQIEGTSPLDPHLCVALKCLIERSAQASQECYTRGFHKSVLMCLVLSCWFNILSFLSADEGIWTCCAHAVPISQPSLSCRAPLRAPPQASLLTKLATRQVEKQKAKDLEKQQRLAKEEALKKEKEEKKKQKEARPATKSRKLWFFAC